MTQDGHIYIYIFKVGNTLTLTRAHIWPAAGSANACALRAQARAAAPYTPRSARPGPARPGPARRPGSRSVAALPSAARVAPARRPGAS